MRLIVCNATYPFMNYQDDSALNRKVVLKLIESVKSGPLKNSRLLEADDGTTAVATLRQELSEGRQVNFVLMDFVMVRGPVNELLFWYFSLSTRYSSSLRSICTGRRLRVSCGRSCSTRAV